MALFIGQGDVMVGKRDANGNVSELRNVGEAPAFEIMLSVDKVTDNETSSGLRRQILSVITKQTAEVTITLKEPTPENLEFMLYGKSKVVAASVLTNVALPNNLVAGKTYRIPGDAVGLSNIVVKDSAGTPRTLVNGTDYILDPTFGTITFTGTGITGSTQPFKVTGNAAGETSVAMMNSTPQNLYVVLHNLNTADNFAPEIWELYNVQIDPTDKLTGKGDASAEFTLKGSALVDTTKPASGDLGQFGRIRKVNRPAA